MSAIQERIRKFIEFKGISARKFERDCDLGNAFVRNIKDSISVTKLEKILQVFPEINKDWLITGEGEMLVPQEPLAPVKVESFELLMQEQGTPVYNMDATCGEVSRPIEFARDQIIGYVNMPNIPKSSAIIRANGESMKPKINDGDWIAVRQINDMDDIFYGQVYLILTNDYRMLKYIRKYEPDEEHFVLLRSENKDYDDIKMRKNKIIRLFVVENILSLKIQF